jgi:hypothetical protein
VCDKASWCIVEGSCAVHEKYPSFQPTLLVKEGGVATPASCCSVEDRVYLEMACEKGLCARITLEERKRAGLEVEDTEDWS